MPPLSAQLLYSRSAYLGTSRCGHRPSRHFVLAGYVLPIERWKPFSDKWAAELITEPSVECFKMSDAEYGDGYFQGMEEPFRKLKINELAQVISDFEPKPISCHLDWQDYKTIVQGRISEKIDSPY